MDKKAILVFFLILLHGEASCQSDSLKTLSQPEKYEVSYLSFRKNFVPVALLGSGLTIEALGIKRDIQDIFPRTNTHVENYLQYAPVGILYGADLLKIPHANTVFNQTKYLFISELVTAIITHTLKIMVHESRPGGGEHSFPSGHTSQSFSSASVVYNEFVHTNKTIAWSGYLFSTTTAILRVTNNRHWVPDVLAGAGIAMLVTNLVYYFHPLKNWDPFHWNDQVVLAPGIYPESDTYSVRVQYIFR